MKKITVDVRQMDASQARLEIEKMIASYKDDVFDHTHPLVLKIYHLHKEYPNDIDFGGKMRAIVLGMEEHIKEKNMIKNNADLEKILNSNT